MKNLIASVIASVFAFSVSFAQNQTGQKNSHQTVEIANGEILYIELENISTSVEIKENNGQRISVERTLTAACAAHQNTAQAIASAAFEKTPISVQQETQGVKTLRVSDVQRPAVVGNKEVKFAESVRISVPKGARVIIKGL